jgi:hypothetical protein
MDGKWKQRNPKSCHCKKICYDRDSSPRRIASSIDPDRKLIWRRRYMTAAIVSITISMGTFGGFPSRDRRANRVSARLPMQHLGLHLSLRRSFCELDIVLLFPTTQSFWSGYSGKGSKRESLKKYGLGDKQLHPLTSTFPSDAFY